MQRRASAVRYPDQRAAGIIRICMLTGARVGEVRQACFEQFNLELGLWSKHASTTKQRKNHRVPISEDVAAIGRDIVTDTGWKMVLDRGLDIFQPPMKTDGFSLGDRMQEHRMLKSFYVTYVRQSDPPEAT